MVLLMIKRRIRGGRGLGMRRRKHLRVVDAENAGALW